MSAKSIAWDSFHNIINGKLRDTESKHYGLDPTTGRQLWPVPVASQKDVDEAVTSAIKAFQDYRLVPLEKRKELLRKYRDLWIENAEKLVDILCKETGKPRQSATFEVYGVPLFFDYFLSLGLPEERVEDEEKILTTRYTPLGVVGAICPWNMPLVLSMGKVIPALLAGNTVIAKPSPFTPYASLKSIEIAQAVFEPGVLQALNGRDDLGPMLTLHPGIAKITFTGSTGTGKKIMASCANTLKRCTLELGGNDAAIILPDVDIKKTAPEVVMGAFQNSGQICVATKRIYIHEKIYTEFLAEMVQFTKTLQVGDPESGSMLGPVQNRMQFERVKELFEDSLNNKHKFAAGGDPISPKEGFFIQPMIVDNPPNDSRIITEEPFGPIVPTQPWSDEEEIIKRTNDTLTGLGACVYGKDIEHAQRIALRLEVGSVWINSFGKPNPLAILSGHKESGIGGEWGPGSLQAYCNSHVVHFYK